MRTTERWCLVSVLRWDGVFRLYLTLSRLHGRRDFNATAKMTDGIHLRATACKQQHHCRLAYLAWHSLQTPGQPQSRHFTFSLTR